jgi:hypothetical protein
MCFKSTEEKEEEELYISAHKETGAMLDASPNKVVGPGHGFGAVMSAEAFHILYQRLTL